MQRAEVVVLIEQLGDDSYSVRAAAQIRIEQIITSDWGYLYLPHVEEACRHEDPEVARRARWAEEAYYSVCPSQYPAIPWLDMLPSDYPNRQELLDRYLRMARQRGFGYAQEWPEYRQATSCYVRDQMRAGWSRAHAVRLLDEMAVREIDWRTRRGGMK
jgi:hypothetical protein